MGIAEGSDGELLYTLTQLSEATIETTAESTDAVDNTGVTNCYKYILLCA